MEHMKGVQIAYQKDGKRYYRASVTHSNKHISLGSFDTEAQANAAYKQAGEILNGEQREPEDYKEDMPLPFAKYIILLNLRNNGIYIKNPIYMQKDHFLYYMGPEDVYKFDRDDLFFYSAHAIQQKGGYLFVSHYGSQYGILSRYGIRKFAVEGRDYTFANGDNHDLRYENILAISHYMGVAPENDRFVTTIHINGNYIVGRYDTEAEAAVAYNKAADILATKGSHKKYIRNYIMEYSKEEYEACYKRVALSSKLEDLKI